VTKVRQPRRHINGDPLPLFAWADTQERRQRRSYPAAWLRRRHPLTPERAELLASLAGLGAAE